LFYQILELGQSDELRQAESTEALTYPNSGSSILHRQPLQKSWWIAAPLQGAIRDILGNGTF
jgi:frataxin-like iron-binding protein CyaY